MTSKSRVEDNAHAGSALGRREFMKKAGRFAALTPPTVTMLLSVSMNSPAVASSGGRPGWGYGDGNHVHSGPPGQNKKSW